LLCVRGVQGMTAPLVTIVWGGPGGREPPRLRYVHFAIVPVVC